MKTYIRRTARRLRSFFSREDGVVTVEFMIIFPVYVVMFLMSFELGRVALNQMVLERGVDLAVRDVRIGILEDPKHADLKEAICDYATMIDDCTNQLQLEMVRMDVRNWSNELDGPIECVDRALDVQPAVKFTNGGNNELMFLRVCTLFDPILPTRGIGKSIPKESGTGYALAATAAFVMEPYQ